MHGKQSNNYMSVVILMLLLFSLPSAIEPLKAVVVFKSQREALVVLQHNLSSVANKLYTKSIISRRALTTTTNQVLDLVDKTVSLLNEVEDRITAEPHVFTEFVRILDSEPTLRLQAKELVEKYGKVAVQSNLSYPGALGLGGARNSDLSVTQNNVFLTQAINEFDYINNVILGKVNDFG